MGVQLGPLLPRREVGLEELRGRRVAVDAMNFLYQFLSIIRQRDGEPLRDSRGRITSHLSGLFYRTANLLEAEIYPIYVFDGKPPELKRGTLEERRVVREKAAEEWERALREGRLEEARRYAAQAARVEEQVVEDAKRLLRLMGLPFVQAPSEGEAQAAHLVRRGDAWAVASQDFDSLLFGSPVLVRNLALTGRRKLPGKDVYVEVRPEVVELEGALSELGLTREQLVDVGILVGTDFNEGVKGIGPKRALELVRKYGSLEGIPDVRVEGLGEIRRIFLEPEVTDDYRLEWGQPDVEGIKEFLCGEHDFSEDRVQSGIQKLLRGREGRQSSLERWF
ncbi:MAG: flap endonuclease-1 [Hadesarchaea archaeon]|jgi:flap endonuclease-1|nr:MAG: flap endonuclease-1 [Hadesarchaea archaeon]